MRSQGGADQGIEVILEFQTESDKDDSVASTVTNLEVDSYFFQSFYFLQMQR